MWDLIWNENKAQPGLMCAWANSWTSGLPALYIRVTLVDKLEIQSRQLMFWLLCQLPVDFSADVRDFCFDPINFIKLEIILFSSVKEFKNSQQKHCNSEDLQMAVIIMLSTVFHISTSYSRYPSLNSEQITKIKVRTFLKLMNVYTYLCVY